MWSVRWPERVEAFVTPERIALHRRTRGLPWSSPVDLSWHVDVGTRAADWPERLAAEPQATALLQGARVHVALSNQDARFALLATGERLLRVDERELAARAALRQTYHGLADGWRVALGDLGPGQAIAVGVPAGTVDAVVDGFGRLGARVVALQPVMARCLNLGRRDAQRPRQCWLACVEPGRVVLAALDGDRILALRSHRAEAIEASGLARSVGLAALQEGVDFATEALLAFEPRASSGHRGPGSDWLLQRCHGALPTAAEPA